MKFAEHLLPSSLLFLFLATGCQGRTLDIGSADQAFSTGSAASNPDTKARPPGVLAKFDTAFITTLTVDDANLYLAYEDMSAVFSDEAVASPTPALGSAAIVRISLDDGTQTPLLADVKADLQGGIVVDDTNVYFLQNSTQIVRVPKTGGASSLVTDLASAGIMMSWKLTNDGTHLYVAAAHDSVMHQAILRIAKADGKIDTLLPELDTEIASIAVTDTDVVFGTGYGGSGDTVRRISKSGGPVQTLSVVPGSGGGVIWVAPIGDRVVYADSGANALAYVPVGGGKAVPGVPNWSEKDLSTYGGFLGFTFDGPAVPSAATGLPPFLHEDTPMALTSANVFYASADDEEGRTTSIHVATVSTSPSATSTSAGSASCTTPVPVK